MQKILALVLIALGVVGLALGRLGETIWAPPSERVATAQITEVGSAVVIDPGVMYMSGAEGTVDVTAGSDVTIIPAPADDVTAYLGDSQHTRITGATDWDTLTVETMSPDGDPVPSDAGGADLWRSTETSASPATIDIAEFSAQEESQPYRAVLLVPADPEKGITDVSITWPVSQSNSWVPYAYAIGAALAIIGLIWFILTLGVRRRDRDDSEHVEEAAEETAVVEEPSVADEETLADEEKPADPPATRGLSSEPETDRITPVEDERTDR